ncbi:MAG: hypothetical protein RL414_118 [Actinomycetota bacterium]|jgi:hypothetical protein
MAKKIETPEAPVITKLPLPNSENALVIDLPDGQKLVVGKMATGTVIEVATWRGTGRPDSRTTRLMLGVTSQEATATSGGESTVPSAPPKKTFIGQLKAYWTKGLETLNKSTQSHTREKKTRVDKPGKSLTSHTTAAFSEIAEPDDQVRAWLDSITAKSEQKVSKQAIIRPAGKKKAVTRKGTTKKSTGKR